MDLGCFLLVWDCFEMVLPTYIALKSFFSFDDSGGCKRADNGHRCCPCRVARSTQRFEGPKDLHLLWRHFQFQTAGPHNGLPSQEISRGPALCPVRCLGTMAYHGYIASTP